MLQSRKGLEKEITIPFKPQHQWEVFNKLKDLMLLFNTGVLENLFGNMENNNYCCRKARSQIGIYFLPIVKEKL